MSIIILISSANEAKAQYTEIGLSLGTMVYTGDVIHTYARHNDYKPAFGAFVAFPLNNHFSFRVNAQKGYISGADSLASRPSSRERNLSFYSDIYEGSLMLDFYPFSFTPLKGGSIVKPYISTGITVFNFNPKSIYQGEEYELQKLRTEGQATEAFPDRKPYELTQVAIPFEVGLKFMTGRKTSFALAGGFRYTFTDYLDDVSKTYVDPAVLIDNYGEVAYALSNRTWGTNGGEPVEVGNSTQRGGADANDYYGWVGLSFSYYVTKEYKYTSSRKSGLHCPKF